MRASLCALRCTKKTFMLHFCESARRSRPVKYCPQAELTANPQKTATDLTGVAQLQRERDFSTCELPTAIKWLA